MEIKHPPENGNCSCKECYKSMSKLDELDLEFDGKFVEGMNYIANANKLGTKEAIKSFARKYHELGKLEERETLEKRIESMRHLPHPGVHCSCLEIEKQVVLSTLNNEK